MVTGVELLAIVCWETGVEFQGIVCVETGLDFSVLCVG